MSTQFSSTFFSLDYCYYYEMILRVIAEWKSRSKFLAVILSSFPFLLWISSISILLWTRCSKLWVSFLHLFLCFYFPFFLSSKSTSPPSEYHSRVRNIFKLFLVSFFFSLINFIFIRWFNSTVVGSLCSPAVRRIFRAIENSSKSQQKYHTDAEEYF